MHNEKPIKIISMGKYLPKKVSSTELEKRLNIPLGWSLNHSGVESRHHVTDECIASMGSIAAQSALDKVQMKLSEIDMIISAGASFDHIIPNQASLIKKEMKEGKNVHIPTIDINTTCLSFISALNISAHLIDGKSIKNILIVSSEIASKGLNPSNIETSTLFGDAAVAAIISYDKCGSSAFIKSSQQTYSEGVFDAIIKGGGVKYYHKDYPFDHELYSFQMKGKNLLRLAKQKIPEFISSFYKDVPFNLNDTSVIIPHQTSKLGFTLFNKLFNFKEDQCKATLRYYGNCIAASIPLTLHDCIENGEIKRGDSLLLIGTSAGFSIGAALLKY